MGIESDQLVFDYLSRVGDLAQQRGLPAAERMRLVAGLRAEIEAHKPDTVSGVKRMLARLGAPDAVVAAAGGAGADRPSVPGPDPDSGPVRRGGLTGRLPGPRDGAGPEPGRAPGPAAAPPHLAGLDELGDAEDPPDWWRVEASPYAPEESVHGFVGGIEIPEIWDRPEGEGDGEGGAAAAGGPADEDGAPEAPEADGKRPLSRLMRRALGRRPAPEADAEEPVSEAEAVAASPWAWLSPVLALAVVLLLAGAVVGSWVALGGGWALVYLSRRLTRAEAKFAALGVPGTAVAGLVVWLWGRFDGRWGERVASAARLGPMILEGLPGVARVAAVVSAAFVLWRLRRRG